MILTDRVAWAGADSGSRLAGDLTKAVELLMRNPYLGRQRDEFTTLPLRFWHTKGFWLVYRPEPFVVVRIIDARRDIAAILG